MTVQEVIAEIPKFSIEDRLELMRCLSRSLEEGALPKTRKGSSAARLRGLLKPENGPPPDDQQVEEMIAEYLTEKYVR